MDRYIADNFDLLEQSDLTGDQLMLCEIIGIEAYRRLAREYGGGQPYIANCEKIVTKKLHQKIIEKFNGSNFFVLAREYHLSERQVRNIVKDKRDEMINSINRDQISLFPTNN